MNNLDYIKSVLKKNDVILIDTSSAMDYKGFKKLVDQIELPLIENNKNIIVPKVVWMELIRHLNSSNEEKKVKASHAIYIINEHRNIFMLEDDNLDYDKMIKTFADAELLSDLIKNKVMYNQLLITNDKKLSIDAFNLNNQESCKGRKINVCYITNSGNLKTCECVYNKKATLEPAIEEKNLDVKTSLSDKEEALLTKVGLPLIAFIAGLVLGKNHKLILKLVEIGLSGGTI